MAMNITEIRDAVLADLTAHVAPVEIVSLEVTEGMDHYGDPIIRLRAIYREANVKITGRQIYEAHWVIQQALIRCNEDRFGLLSLVSEIDLKDAAA
jgi:hypothetical protein